MPFELNDRELKFLLDRAGWLDTTDDESTMREIVARYQEWHGLRVDGVAGPRTYRSLARERFCGYPDDYSPPAAIGGGINRWGEGKRHLTIQCVGSLGTLPDDVFRAGTLTAANLWAAVCGLTFELVEQGGDIVIDTGVIDGPGRTLAYMELPPTDGFNGRLSGRADDSERWNVQIPLVPVICHEFGHALGLGHTNVARQLMNPMLSDLVKPQAAWDIQEVVKRYGEPKAKPTTPGSPNPGDPRVDGWQDLPFLPSIKFRAPSIGGGSIEFK